MYLYIRFDSLFGEQKNISPWLGTEGEQVMFNEFRASPGVAVASLVVFLKRLKAGVSERN